MWVGMFLCTIKLFLDILNIVYKCPCVNPAFMYSSKTENNRYL